MTVTEGGSAGVATPLKGIRRTAARRMVAAWEAPVFHLDVEVDMTSALSIKERVPGATVTDALLAACARALLEHPALNACYADEVVTTYDTFTVSNLGMMGIDRFDAILNVPQVAILAVGSTRMQHVWNGGEPAWRPVSALTLTCDHRAIDGATGAGFLTAVRDHLASA